MPLLVVLHEVSTVQGAEGAEGQSYSFLINTLTICLLNTERENKAENRLVTCVHLVTVEKKDIGNQIVINLPAKILRQ